jgi:hypothetical protein
MNDKRFNAAWLTDFKRLADGTGTATVHVMANRVVLDPYAWCYVVIPASVVGKDAILAEAWSQCRDLFVRWARNAEERDEQHYATIPLDQEGNYARAVGQAELKCAELKCAESR